MVQQGHLEMIRYWVLGLFSVALLLAWPAMAARDKITLSAYAKSPVGSVLFLRHALAPGNGDPADFTLADSEPTQSQCCWQAAQPFIAAFSPTCDCFPQHLINSMVPVPRDRAPFGNGAGC